MQHASNWHQSVRIVRQWFVSHAAHASFVGERPWHAIMQTVSSVLILTRMPRMTCRVALAAVLLCAAVAAALGGKRAPIPDDLRDVIDDEEDDEWRRYGTPPSRGPGRGDGPPPDLSRMDPAALQDELLRGQTGPSFGFVKLRPGTARSRVRIPRPRSLARPHGARSSPRLTVSR
jgi:hypothetical protein